MKKLLTVVLVASTFLITACGVQEDEAVGTAKQVSSVTADYHAKMVSTEVLKEGTK
tara:strand:- start:3009 stop:3176 length:168 start_codon:yes stop_codon:yes gene_type:complete